MLSPTIFDVVAVDPSLSAAGIAVVRIVGELGSGSDARNFVRVFGVRLLRSEIVGTEAKSSHAIRLAILRDTIADVAAAALRDTKSLVDVSTVFAMEGPSFGSPFQRIDAGRVDAATRLGFYDAAYRARKIVDPESDEIEIREVSPRSAKAVAVPDHPGFSKALWKNANKPFKRSMPDKAAVMTGVANRFGINVADDAIADAVAIAVAAVTARPFALLFRDPAELRDAIQKKKGRPDAQARQDEEARRPREEARRPREEVRRLPRRS